MSFDFEKQKNLLDLQYNDLKTLVEVITILEGTLLVTIWFATPITYDKVSITFISLTFYSILSSYILDEMNKIKKQIANL